jgi:PEGA domain-containing protein
VGFYFRKSLRFGLVTAISLVGCATEHTVIISNPAGAKVTVNNHYIGETPVIFSVNRNDWPETNAFPCKLELEGYSPADCTFSGQRWQHIVGDIFTLGTIRIFRGPYGLRDEIRRDLRPLTAPRQLEERRAPAAPRGRDSSPTGTRRCTTEQILSMKKSGLDDDQVRRACE